MSQCKCMDCPNACTNGVVSSDAWEAPPVACSACRDPEAMNTDPEAIAREILRIDADRSAAEPQGDFFDYMVALRKTAPTLAAAYLDLRAQLDTTRAKLVESETWRTELRQEIGAAKGQLRDVKAQRDELREAADDFVSRVSNVVPVDSFGHRKTSLQRLRAALEAAR